MGGKAQTTAAAALSQEWLSRPEKINHYYASLRDRIEPGKPLWITGTADAACGGNPWASTFLDTFRYVVEHASLARRGVKVIMHNTLAASDYGLLDQNTLEPRPNYWATVLWHRLMSTTVLDPQVSVAANTYVYAQCLTDRPGGVTLLIINADRQHSFDLNVPTASERYGTTTRRRNSGAQWTAGSAYEQRGSAAIAGRADQSWARELRARQHHIPNHRKCGQQQLPGRSHERRFS